ncbi:hypothetical protein [Nonomuraea sp. NPDC049129]|uniref:hypothetical protein n=1 Tax=Nonomuraea sp. NPDC049129 TaxID=3155272 RepID=UPI0033D6D254
MGDKRALPDHGLLIRPPGRADRVSAWARRVACVTPAALGVWAAARTGGGAAWLPLLAGLLVSGHVAGRMTAWRGLVRKRARLRRWGEIIVLAAGTLLVFSPAGEWLASAWATTAWATAFNGVFLVAAVLLLQVGVGTFRAVARPPKPLRAPLALCSVLATVLLRYAWTPFLLAYVAHPDPRLAVPALALCLVETVETLHRIAVGTPQAQHSDVQVITAVNLGEWLYDGFLTRRRRPDYALISALLLDARLTVGSVSAEAALRRVELAELALDLVDEEVVPRTTRRLARHQEIQRTCCLWLRAEIYQYLGLEDEVLATWRECARRFSALALPRMAAQARHTAWSRLITRHGLGSVDLDHELLSPDDSPYLRRNALLGLAVITQQRGDEEGARRLEARAMAIRRSGIRERLAWGQEQALTFNTHPFALLMGVRGHTNLDKQLRSWLSRRTPAPFPAWGNPIRDLALRADDLVTEGRPAEAAALFTEAALRARAAGQVTWEMNALTGLSQLARSVGDMEVARDSLLEAVRSAEDVRGRALSPDLRISAGGSISGLYDLGVWLFASATPQALGDGGTAVTAWQFSELGRSRVFLELLGERLPPPAEGSAAEREAYDTYVRLRDLSDLESPGAAQAVRKAHDEWHAACAELAAQGGAAGEYAALRLGRPIEYDELRRLLGTVGEVVPADTNTDK